MSSREKPSRRTEANSHGPRSSHHLISTPSNLQSDQSVSVPISHSVGSSSNACIILRFLDGLR